METDKIFIWLDLKKQLEEDQKKTKKLKTSCELKTTRFESESTTLVNYKILQKTGEITEWYNKIKTDTSLTTSWKSRLKN